MLNFHLGLGGWFAHRLLAGQRSPPKKNASESGEMIGGISAKRNVFVVSGPQIVQIGFGQIKSPTGSKRTLLMQVGFNTPLEDQELRFARQRYAQWSRMDSTWNIPIQSVTNRSGLGEVLQNLEDLFFELDFEGEIYWNWDLPDKAIANVQRFVTALNNFWDFGGTLPAKQLVVPGVPMEEIDHRIKEYWQREGFKPRVITREARIACLRHEYSNYDALRTADGAATQRLRQRVNAAIARTYPCL